MSDGFIAILVSIVGTVGAVLNLWITLRTKLSVLESERSILDQVDDKYVQKETCAALVAGHGPFRRRGPHTPAAVEEG